MSETIKALATERGFPDPSVTSEEMLFGDCIIIEGSKAP